MYLLVARANIYSILYNNDIKNLLLFVSILYLYCAYISVVRCKLLAFVWTAVSEDSPKKKKKFEIIIKIVRRKKKNIDKY